MYSIAESLREHRQSRNLTQSELAKQTQIGQPKISYYESGEHIPPIDLCIKLADFYGITLDELVGREI